MQLTLFLQLFPYLTACYYLPALFTISRCRFDFCSARRARYKHSGTARGTKTPAGIIGMSAVWTEHCLIGSFNFMLCLPEPA